MDLWLREVFELINIENWIYFVGLFGLFLFCSMKDCLGEMKISIEIGWLYGVY